MRRLISAVLCMFLAVVLAIPGSAAGVPQKIKSIHPEFSSLIAVVELNGEELSLGNLSDLTVQSGSQLRIYLSGSGDQPSLFFDQNGDAISTTDVTLSKLQAARLQIEVTGDTDILDAVKFGYANRVGALSSAAPYIGITFTRDIFTTMEMPFSVAVRLRMDGETLEDTEIAMSGVIKAETCSVTAETEWIDLTEGTVLLAEEDIESVELYLGEGVTLSTGLQKGTRYYGSVKVERIDQALNGVPATAEVLLYSLNTMNLNNSRCTVSFEGDVALYVYSAAGKYLGTTKQSFPYADQYILINRRLIS